MLAKTAVVVTSWKLSKEYLDFFIERNHKAASYRDCKIIVVSDLPGHVPYPESDDGIFSITRAANAGVSEALARNMEVIIKTDIDCILSDDFFRFVSANVKGNRGYAFRYWQLYQNGKTKRDPRTMGTIAMTRKSWINCSGYNQQMRGYGYDDYDIVMRARRTGSELRIVREPKVLHVYHEKHNRNTVNPVMRKENFYIASQENKS